MDKSPACESIGTASPKSDGPHKKTAEELVDEMFDAVWQPKSKSPNNAKGKHGSIEEHHEGGGSEEYDEDYDDDDHDHDHDDDHDDDHHDDDHDDDHDESIEDEFEAVEAGVQQIIAGKINSISETSGVEADAERLEMISKKINEQLESNLKRVHWKRGAGPKTGLRFRGRRSAHLPKSKRRSKRVPGSSSIYKSNKRRAKRTGPRARKTTGPSAKRRHAAPARMAPRPSAKLLMAPRSRAPLWAPKESTSDEAEVKGLVLRRDARAPKLTAAERKEQQRKKMKEKAKRNPWFEAELKAQQAVQRKKAAQKNRRAQKRQRAKEVTQHLQSLPTEDWLKTIGREDLGPMLVHEGFVCLHELLDLTEKELHMLLRNHCGVALFKERASFHKALRAYIKQLLTADDPPPLQNQARMGSGHAGDLRSIVRNTANASDEQFNLDGSRLSAKLPPIHPGVNRTSKSSDQFRSQMLSEPAPDRANSVT